MCWVAELSIVLVLTTSSVHTFPPHTDTQDTAVHNTLIQRMDHIQSMLGDVTSQLANLDSDLEKTLYPCPDEGNSLCLAVDTGLTRGQHRVKRSSQGLVDRLLQELKRKQSVLKHLSSLFNGADDIFNAERKRSCNLNLGFHCQTEEISNYADMYDFLSSPLSPGKRKRAAQRSRPQV